MAGNRDLSKFANQLFVDSNGNIGLATNVNIAIGHTNPSYKFDLLGPANINGSLNVNGQATFNSDVVFSSQISNVNVSDIITNNVSVSGSLTALSIASTTFTSENVDIDYLNVSGVSTFNNGSFVGLSATSLNVSGVSTFNDSLNIADILQIGGSAISISTTTAVTIDTLSTSSYRSAKFQVQITQSSNYQSSDLMVIHNGTTSSLIEYGSIATNDYLGEFSSTISGSNLLLQLTMNTDTSATVKVVRYGVTI